MVDINECKIGADNCAAADSTCTDTLGNFECTCNPGFSGDGTIACLSEFQLSTVNECKFQPIFRYDQHCSADINECDTGADNCVADATCMDTPGSFECVCDPGFSGDGTIECVLLGEYTVKSHDCNALKLQCQHYILC